MRRVLRVIQEALFYLFLSDLIDLSFQIQDMYTYFFLVLLLFLHWMYIRDFFLNFFSFFLIFMGEIALTSILALTFLCESAIWNNRIVLGLRLGSGVGLEFRIVIKFLLINRIQISYLWIHIFFMLFLCDFMGFLWNFDTLLFKDWLFLTNHTL